MIANADSIGTLGGKFANGAVTGAFSYLFNCQLTGSGCGPAEKDLYEKTGMTKDEFINASPEQRAKRIAQHQRSLEVDQKISSWKEQQRLAKEKYSVNRNSSIVQEGSYVPATVEISGYALKLLEAGIIPVGKFNPFTGLKGEAFERNT